MTPDAEAQALEDVVLRSPTATASELRLAAAAIGRGQKVEVPPALLPFLQKVARSAWEITTDDVNALRAAGISEETIFELTLSTAVGAGLGRLERGLAALKASPR